MTDIILHHYAMSTFSEKVRLAMGLKRLAYREVLTPPVMPKPDLLPLTGGYRRAPVLQIGADVYCDTQLILRTLERLHPEPTLFPDNSEGQATALAFWAERFIFPDALGFVANVNPEIFPPEFVAERKPFGFILGLDEVRPLFKRYAQQLAGHFGWFERMLADGRRFVLGSEPSAADLGVYLSVWFLQEKGKADARTLLGLDAVAAWAERVAAIGHGRPEEIAGGTALDVARDAEPTEPKLPANGDPSGIRDGTRVTVTADDTGRDPIAGVLVAASHEEVVIRREDERVGTVHLHFPRVGFDVAPA
ncbi:MAG: glutathione S-transferase family protein [Gluconacetobacter diazotrophicus]|nr:glutathione S-transferase family protein [Gluconacetobacter diazotrophicus]